MSKVFASVLVFSMFALAGPMRTSYQPGEMMQIAQEALKQYETKIEVIKHARPNFRETFLAYDRAGGELSGIIRPILHLSNVAPEETVRNEATEVEKVVRKATVDIDMSKELYHALLAGFQNSKHLNPVQKRLVEKILRDFELSGLNLPDDKFEELKNLKKELADISSDFEANVVKDGSQLTFTREELTGLPEDFLARQKRTEDGKFIVDVLRPNIFEIEQNARSSKTRQSAVTAYEKRAPKNRALVVKLFEVRQKIAKLMGYDNYAQLALKARQPKTPENAMAFIDGLVSKSEAQARIDLDILQRYKAKVDPQDGPLKQWDIRYYENQIRKKYFADEEEVRQYFPVDSVVNKMFKLYSRLFGFSIYEIKNPDVWMPGVKLYALKSGTGKVFAYLYTDLIARLGKRGGAFASDLVPRKITNGKPNVLVAAMTTNFPPPSPGKPSLLSHDDVVTLFHEFGHNLHQLLTKAPYTTLAGSNVVDDFVEVPSQTLENWVWSPEHIHELSGHYLDPRKKMPSELIKKIIAGRDFNKGYYNARQLLFGKLDMTLHMTPELAEHPDETYNRLYKQVIGIDPVPGSMFTSGFTHFLGYDAAYYVYKMAEVGDADIFSVFNEEGLNNRNIGYRYRRTILAKGNTVEPDALLEEFLGRKPNDKAFLKELSSYNCQPIIEQIFKSN